MCNRLYACIGITYITPCHTPYDWVKAFSELNWIEFIIYYWAVLCCLRMLIFVVNFIANETDGRAEQTKINVIQYTECAKQLNLVPVHSTLCNLIHFYCYYRSTSHCWIHSTLSTVRLCIYVVMPTCVGFYIPIQACILIHTHTHTSERAHTYLLYMNFKCCTLLCDVCYFCIWQLFVRTVRPPSRIQLQNHVESYTHSLA